MDWAKRVMTGVDYQVLRKVVDDGVVILTSPGSGRIDMLVKGRVIDADEWAEGERKWTPERRYVFSETADDYDGQKRLLIRQCAVASAASSPRPRPRGARCYHPTSRRSGCRLRLLRSSGAPRCCSSTSSEACRPRAWPCLRPEPTWCITSTATRLRWLRGWCMPG